MHEIYCIYEVDAIYKVADNAVSDLMVKSLLDSYIEEIAT